MYFYVCASALGIFSALSQCKGIVKGSKKGKKNSKTMAQSIAM